jgi:hypothetical protein
MQGSGELGGILDTKSPLAGGLIEQGEVRNLPVRHGWKLRGLGRWGWKPQGLDRRGWWRRLERRTGWLRGEEAVGVREWIVASRQMRRGLVARTGLGERRGIRLELVEESSLAGH